ncbi:hypothetical protein G6F24_018165 [Rhizopus arrhizus]|nr:hypothetical protein G6F24_018165 [Rhizopus arrhizus]
MQVAVTDVAEPDHVEMRIGLPEQRLGLGQERRHRRDPHRDIVLVRWAAWASLALITPSLTQPLPMQSSNAAIAAASCASSLAANSVTT